MDNQEKILFVVLILTVIVIIGEVGWLLAHNKHPSSFPVPTLLPSSQPRQQLLLPTSKPPADGFVLPDNKPAGPGFTQVSTDGSSFLLVGKIVSVSEDKGSVYATVGTANASGQALNQKVMLFNAKQVAPFNLQRQSMGSLFPMTGKDATAQTFDNLFHPLTTSDPQQIINSVQAVANKPAAIYFTMSSSFLPTITPPSGFDLDAWKGVFACNTQFYQALNSGSAISCVPFTNSIRVREE